MIDLLIVKETSDLFRIVYDLYIFCKFKRGVNATFNFMEEAPRIATADSLTQQAQSHAYRMCQTLAYHAMAQMSQIPCFCRRYLDTPAVRRLPQPPSFAYRSAQRFFTALVRHVPAQRCLRLIHCFRSHSCQNALI